MQSNFHSHCQYCDGKENPEKYIQQAIQDGFSIYGFSSHAPIKKTSKWNMKVSKLPEYVKELQFLKNKYQNQIEIYIGLETDFQYGYYHVNTLKKEFDINYTIGSIHYAGELPDGSLWEVDGRNKVFQKGLNELFFGSIESAIRHYFKLTREMIREETPDILGHLDKIKIQSENGKLFNDKEKWYRDEIMETLEIVQKYNTIVEVNTRGWYKGLVNDFYPSGWIIREMYLRNIPIMINSDAHHPGEISMGLNAAATFLKNIGYKTQRVLFKNQWTEIPVI